MAFLKKEVVLGFSWLVLGRLKRSIGPAHFLGLHIRDQNPVILSIPTRCGRRPKTGQRIWAKNSVFGQPRLVPYYDGLPHDEIM
jgi:hypothetical protein